MSSGFNCARSQHKNLKPVPVPSATEITEQMYSLFSQIEDPYRVRTGHAPQNLALLRRIALNALNP